MRGEKGWYVRLIGVCIFLAANAFLLFTGIDGCIQWFRSEIHTIVREELEKHAHR